MEIKLTPEQFKQKSAQAVANGLNITGESGTVSGQGVTANYHYDSAKGVLTINVTHKPWAIPESIVESKIREGLGV